VLDVLDFLGWMYRYVPYPAVIEVIDNTTATGIVVSRTFGSDTIQQESVLTAGGTAAVIPSRLNVEPITEKAQQTDLIRIVYRNTSAGALTVNGIIQLTRMTA
jgi:uncharacterized protein CbrC (UPF0167 family)